jgi:hypothetical protein
MIDFGCKTLGYWPDHTLKIRPFLDKHHGKPLESIKRIKEKEEQEIVKVFFDSFIDENFKNTTDFIYCLSYITNSKERSLKDVYMGKATCRLCGEKLGSKDYYSPDGKWKFPEKFEHYLVEHDIKPYQQFIDDAKEWSINAF